MNFSLRLKSMGLILRFLASVIYSAIPRIEFLVPFINLNSKLLENLLNLINLSIDSIFDSSFSSCIRFI